MKQELDDASRAALVKYRMTRATETLKEVDLLSDNGYFNTAVCRLYYACFYATEALLLDNKIQAQTHSGVKTMFGMHFVATGKVPIAIGKTLSTLFEKRQSGDYEDFVLCDYQDVIELKAKAVDFIQCIERLLSHFE